MKRHSTWISLAAVVAWVVAAPGIAAGQDRAGASPPSSGGGSSVSAPSSGGGSTSSSGGGGSDRAGASSGGTFSGGMNRSDGGHGGATGGSGVAMPRTGDYNRGGERSSAGASGRTGYSTSAGRDDERVGVPEFSRPRDGETQSGTAIPRPAGSVPSRGGSNYVVVPGGYYGYGYPYGNGGYYSGYYGSYYSGYYDPFYDPWYGGYYSSYSYSQSSGGYSYGNDDGALRLKIKPRNAEVYVDGYYVGIVDDFDGLFQRLHIESGAHRIEVRAPGYEPLVFEVKITPEHTTTYQGEMKKIQ